MYRAPMQLKGLLKKLAQLDSDIFFLTRCKKEHLIPNGLSLKNPIQNTYNTHYSQRLCYRTSERLRNHLIHVFYSTRRNVQMEIQTLRNTLTGNVQQQMQHYYTTLQSYLIVSKQKKLHRLRLKAGLHSASNQVPSKHNGMEKSCQKDKGTVSCVINLSSHKPTNLELRVLSRGLTFCPTKPLDKTELCSDMEQYFRRLRLKEFFFDGKDDLGLPSSQTQVKLEGKKTSDWTPPHGRNHTLDQYINSFRHSVQTTILDKQRKETSNISAQERRAIHSLKNNKEITIKPADKGGAIVLLNTMDYIKEAHRQLTNMQYYSKLDEDPTPKYKRELKKVIRGLHTDSTNLLDFIPEDPRLGIFYMLPKIHKPGNPGRPIISGVGTLTEKISGWVENVLKPLVRKTASYLQDTTDLLKKLSTIGPLPKGTILATMDVESLYSNIPHEDGLMACKMFLDANGIPSESVLKLTRFILTHNSFCFGEELYLQRTGTAMGSKMAPQYANLFMAKLENDFLATCSIKPLAYFRYIDDILIIWTGSEQELVNFHERFNIFHPTIKLTLDHSNTEINFLDTTIKIQNGSVQTSVYRKPIDRSTYLRWDSFHPKHIKKSIVYSQALRYNRICSNPTDRDEHLTHLKNAFLYQGYHPTSIDDQINRATRIPRSQLLQYGEKKENNRVPLVVTYSPQLEMLRKMAKNLHHILHKDDQLKIIFKDPPLLCYRQPPNLRNIVVRSSMPSDTPRGTYPCNGKSCKTCTHIMTTDRIQIHNSNQDYKFPGTYTCSSSNVVYLLLCTMCPTGGLYVGETGQKLRARMRAHRHTITDKKTHQPVAKHFCGPGHNINNMKVVILKGNFKSQKHRRVWEQKFMRAFDTLHTGLNLSEGFMTYYKI